MFDQDAFARMIREEILAHVASINFGGVGADSINAMNPEARLLLLSTGKQGGVTRPFASPFPDPVALAHVAGELFWASMLAEEGRPCRPNLIYTPDSHHTIGPNVRLKAFLHELSEPVPLTREALRKISQAQGGGLTWAVRHGRPVVTGLEPEGISNGLRLIATGAGAIDVLWQRSLRFIAFRGGEAVRLSTTALRDLTGTSFSLGLRLEADDLSELSVVLGEIMKAGHGGAIWVLPDGSDAPDGITLPRRLVDQLSLKERIGTPEANTPEKKVRWLKSVAMLANVDGAVLMDASLRLLGFGAFVKLSAQPIPMQKWLPDGRASLTNSGDGVGGRHRSAAEFCASYRPAAAFTVSEDGAVTAFAALNPGEHVQCHPVVRVGSTFIQ